MTAVLTALTLLFLLSFFNRFAALRSGDGEYVNGMALLSGHLPYRDYYTTAPPLNLLKSALLLKTFGGTLLVSRIAGVIERLLIAFILFRWLARIFRPWHALAASIVTIIVSTGDRSDPISSYNHDAILWAMLAGLFASLALDALPARKTAAFAALAGASAALSLLTKQTVGLGAVLCTFAAGAILLLSLHRPRTAKIWCAAFTAGCALPLGGATLWLLHMHVLHPFLQMLFVKGPAAKAGHLSDLFFRELIIARGNPVWIFLALIAIALTWRPIQRALIASEPAPGPGHTTSILVAGTLIIGAAELLALTSIPALQDFSKSSVYFVFLGLTLWLATRLLRVLHPLDPPLTPRMAQAILFAAVSWTITAMLSLSWPAFEAMTLPGLGFLLAATLEGVRPRFKWFTLLVMSAMVFLQVREKLDLPFAFNHIEEAPIRFATTASTLPQLRGLRLPAPMTAFLDQSTHIILTSTSPRDTIFTYPEMSLLYTVTGRLPPTFALSHNIDVVSDTFARQEAVALRRSPPAAIVFYRQSEDQLRADELTWRHGAPSGQRDLIAAVEDLVAGYRLAGTWIAAPGTPPISLYIRK